jgi:hypothetical protein
LANAQKLGTDFTFMAFKKIIHLVTHTFKTVGLTSLSLVGRPFLVRAPPVKAL